MRAKSSNFFSGERNSPNQMSEAYPFTNNLKYTEDSLRRSGSVVSDKSSACPRRGNGEKKTSYREYLDLCESESSPESPSGLLERHRNVSGFTNIKPHHVPRLSILLDAPAAVLRRRQMYIMVHPEQTRVMSPCWSRT